MKHVIPSYKNFLDLLQDAVDKEKDAHLFYKEAAERTDDPEIRSFLEELAGMELEHYEKLRNKLESLRADQTVMDGILSSYNDEKGEEEKP